MTSTAEGEGGGVVGGAGLIKRMKLSDISDLRSSLENSDSTTFSIEPTQVYDVERYSSQEHHGDLEMNSDSRPAAGVSCSSLSFSRHEPIHYEPETLAAEGGERKSSLSSSSSSSAPSPSSSPSSKPPFNRAKSDHSKRGAAVTPQHSSVFSANRMVNGMTPLPGSPRSPINGNPAPVVYDPPPSPLHSSDSKLNTTEVNALVSEAVAASATPAATLESLAPSSSALILSNLVLPLLVKSHDETPSISSDVKSATVFSNTARDVDSPAPADATGINAAGANAATVISPTSASRVDFIPTATPTTPIVVTPTTPTAANNGRKSTTHTPLRRRIHLSDVLLPPLPSSPSDMEDSQGNLSPEGSELEEDAVICPIEKIQSIHDCATSTFTTIPANTERESDGRTSSCSTSTLSSPRYSLIEYSPMSSPWGDLGSTATQTPAAGSSDSPQHQDQHRKRLRPNRGSLVPEVIARKKKKKKKEIFTEGTTISITSTSSQKSLPPLPRRLVIAGEDLCFNRIFGLWRDDQSYYPGTIKSVIVGSKNGTVKIEFDDRTKATLSYAECRHCRLEINDKVKLYRGEEAPFPLISMDEDDNDLELTVTVGTSAKGVVCDSTEVNTMAVGENVEDVEVNPRPTTPTTRTTSLANAEADATFQVQGKEQQSLIVRDIYIPNYCTHLLDNRQLSTADIAILEGRSSTQTKLPKNLIPITRDYPFSTTERSKRNIPKHGFFTGMGFLMTNGTIRPPIPSPSILSTTMKRKSTGGGGEVTHDQVEEEDRVKLRRRIETNGGCVLEPNDDLISFKGKRAGEPLETKMGDVYNLHTVLLISDQPTTTPKYLLALSLNIPCVSRDFILESLDQGRCLPWRLYILPAGYLDNPQQGMVPVMGPQHRSLCKKRFDASLIKVAGSQYGVFKQARILVVFSEEKKKVKGKTAADIESLRLIFAGAGASSCDFIYFDDLLLNTSENVEEYHFVVLEGRRGGAGGGVIGAGAGAGAGGVVHQRHYDEIIPFSIRHHRGLVTLEWAKKCIIWGSLRPI